MNQIAKHLERDIKGAIIQYLKIRGHLVIPFRNVGIYKRETGQYIPSLQLGVPDILGVERGGNAKAFFIEVKRPGNKLSKHQEKFIEIAKGFGCKAMVAYSIEDVKTAGL